MVYGNNDATTIPIANAIQIVPLDSYLKKITARLMPEPCSLHYNQNGDYSLLITFYGFPTL